MKINWGTGITLVFILFALLMARMVFIAMGSEVNLVSDDYYQQEVDFQSRIEKIKNAESFEKLITLSFNSQEQMIELQFPEKFNSTEGIIHFFRPSDNHLDKKITLVLNQENKQEIPFSFLNKKGLWRVKIDWDGDGKEFFVEKPLVIE
jgi:hypothetical protein